MTPRNDQPGGAPVRPPRGGLLRSAIFRRTLTIVLLLTMVAVGVITLVGWHSNNILTKAAEHAIQSDIGKLREEFRVNGLSGLTQAVERRSQAATMAVYYLSVRGEKIAGNLATLPVLSASDGRRGIFHYRPVGPLPAAERVAAGNLIEIDADGLLLVGQDVEEQRAVLAAIYRSIAAGAGVLALIGLMGSVLIARHILRRIEDVNEASTLIMAGDLTGRIATDGSNDELDRLAVRLNAMLARIEQLMGGLREVSDNIAHDLKTPLNRLRNRAEAALIDSRGGAAWHAGLERVIEEADEIIRTFNALLLIARLEAGSIEESFESVDLAALVAELGELYEPVAQDAGFELDCEAGAPVMVAGNRQLLGQALTNLIDNALKYASDDSGGPLSAEARTISISAGRNDGRAFFSVADQGGGVTATDRARVLERFVRLEKSRSKPGTGLGLSLVAAVARLHGGAVRLEDNTPGLKVVVEIPLQPGETARGRSHQGEHGRE